jgi:Nitrous oxide-stimulated promoter
MDRRSSPPALLPRNLVLDALTVQAMVRIYCEDRHGSNGLLCQDCAELVDYADYRLARCPFGAEKTTCRECPIHCYRPEPRAAMKAVMHHAGPRMLLRHPWLAVRHLLLERKGPPPRPPRGASERA